MSEELKMNLLKGKYEESKKICEKMAVGDIRDAMMMVAYNTENICVYSFTQYMIQKTGKIDWIEIAIDLMLNPLCFLEGAYSVALFHARELLEIERSVINLERMLFFYHIPEKLLDEKEARCIAEEILNMEPNNELALRVKS